MINEVLADINAPPLLLPQPSPHYQRPPSQPGVDIDASTGAPFLSPRRISRLKIKLKDFCDRYGISDSDCRKLRDLECASGRSKVENLPVEEWKVGFTRLGLEDFLEAHTECLEDIAEGRWDIGAEAAAQLI